MPLLEAVTPQDLTPPEIEQAFEGHDCASGKREW